MLACQDRLLRVLKDSTCNFEIEICGIPSVVQIVPKFSRNKETTTTEPAKMSGEDGNKKSHKDSEVNLCYGTLDGKIAMVTLQFIDKNELEPMHHWQVPLNTIKQPVTCLLFSQTNAEFFVGRSDGSIEVLAIISFLNFAC